VIAEGQLALVNKEVKKCDVDRLARMRSPTCWGFSVRPFTYGYAKSESHFIELADSSSLTEAEVLARFKADTDDDDNRSDHSTLSVQTSRGRYSVRRFTISNNKPIDPRRVSGSKSSQITERRERYMAMLGMVK
jgi:hypothetical protein